MKTEILDRIKKSDKYSRSMKIENFENFEDFEKSFTHYFDEETQHLYVDFESYVEDYYINHKDEVDVRTSWVTKPTFMGKVKYLKSQLKKFNKTKTNAETLIEDNCKKFNNDFELAEDVFANFKGKMEYALIIKNMEAKGYKLIPKISIVNLYSKIHSKLQAFESYNKVRSDCKIFVKIK